MKPSFHSVNASASRAMAKRKVKRAEVEERMVLDVTEVLDSDTLNVNCATYHSGATCTQTGGRREAHKTGRRRTSAAAAAA